MCVCVCTARASYVSTDYLRFRFDSIAYNIILCHWHWLSFVNWFFFLFCVKHTYNFLSVVTCFSHFTIYVCLMSVCLNQIGLKIVVVYRRFICKTEWRAQLHKRFYRIRCQRERSIADVDLLIFNFASQIVLYAGHVFHFDAPFSIKLNNFERAQPLINDF